MLFQVDIEKFWNGEYWSNRYIVDAASLAAAQTEANTILGYERAIHLDAVQFTKVRTSDMDAATDVFLVDTPNLAGQVLSGTTGALPLFNVAVVDFPAGMGRPSRKYLRLPLREEDVHDGNLLQAAQDRINNNYGTPLGALASFVDVDGQPLGAGRVKRAVGMRQLRRGSKRKAQPIIGNPA